MPSLSHARMLSLHLDGIVIQSQIPTKFIPTQPESTMKTVNIKLQFHLRQAVFRQVLCLVREKKVLQSRTTLDFFQNPLSTHFLPATKQAVSKRLMHVQSAIL